MAKSKSNYTEAMETELLAAYQAVLDSQGVNEEGEYPQNEEAQKERSAVVSAFATKFNLKEASVRGKLSREGIYVAKVTLTKNGQVPEKKEEIVSEIAKLLGSTEEKCDSLGKATKGVLSMIRDALRPEEVETSETEGETAEG